MRKRFRNFWSLYWPVGVFIIGIVLLAGVAGRGEQNKDHLARDLARASKTFAAEQAAILLRVCNQQNDGKERDRKLAKAFKEILRLATVPQPGMTDEQRAAQREFRIQAVGIITAAGNAKPTKCTQPEANP